MFLHSENVLSRFARKSLLLAGACTFLAISSQAAILNYNISYTGTGQYTSGETVTGLGTFQVTTTGLTGTITGFSFTDTITGVGSSTYNYSLANLLNVNSVTVGGTAANPTLATITLATGYVAGTNSAAFGNANFVGNYAAVNPGTGSTSTNPTVNAGFTFGTILITPSTVTVPTATPEPATFALFGFGLAGLAGNYLRRRSRS